MKKIELTQGYYALIDDLDFELVSKFSWWVYKRKNRRCFYAITNIFKNGKRTTTGMHRMIMNFPKNEIDHKNGNGLDNRRLNIRLCLRGQNMRNVPKFKKQGLTSKYKGVSFHKRNNLWRSRISFNGRCFFLGNYTSQKEAAMAYDGASKTIHSKFGKTNKKLGIL